MLPCPPCWGFHEPRFGEPHDLRASARAQRCGRGRLSRLARIAEDGKGFPGRALDPEVSLSSVGEAISSCPCYRVNERCVPREMLETVLAQSYVRRELVLVDSESESSKVPGIVERIADDRHHGGSAARQPRHRGQHERLGIQHARGEHARASSTDRRRAGAERAGGVRPGCRRASRRGPALVLRRWTV